MMHSLVLLLAADLWQVVAIPTQADFRGFSLFTKFNLGTHSVETPFHGLDSDQSGVRRFNLEARHPFPANFIFTLLPLRKPAGVEVGIGEVGGAFELAEAVILQLAVAFEEADEDGEAVAG